MGDHLRAGLSWHIALRLLAARPNDISYFRFAKVLAAQAFSEVAASSTHFRFIYPLLALPWGRADGDGPNGNQRHSAPGVTLWAHHRLCLSTGNDSQRGCAPVAGTAHRFGFFTCDRKVGEVASAGSVGYWRS